MAAWIRGKLLGAGAFGSVNLAMKRENGEVFAVKSVPMNYNGATSEVDVAVQAIENEINILQDLNSNFVVRYLGSDCTVEESSGLVMRNAFLEYMPEGCLIDFVKQFGSPALLQDDEHLLRTYTRSIVQGIEYLHSQGIVHGDIKGKNILVGNDAGAVKLTDFGSSKRLGEKNCAPAKVNGGTPLWMAPEVVSQVEQITPASDIWSLGCTVVEMATGRAPWSCSNFPNQFAALYHIACTDDLPEVPASLSAEAHDFLSHCFQRDPSQRWTSAELLQHPFLTTRFVTPPTTATPTDFPADAAPSLFKRGLVSKVQDHEQIMEPENWWSNPENSAPWIVVRSPQSCASDSSPSEMTSIEDQDYCAGNVATVAVSAVSPLLDTSRCLETSTSAEKEVGVSDSDANGIDIVATDGHVRNFAISEMDLKVAGQDCAGNIATAAMSAVSSLLNASGCLENSTSVEEEVGVLAFDTNDSDIVATDGHVPCFAISKMDLKLGGQDCAGNVAAVAVSAVSPLLDASRCLETSTSVEEEVCVSDFDANDIEIVATDAFVCYFVISEMDLKLAERVVVFGNHARFLLRESFDESPSTSLYIGRIEYTISEYSEHGNVYSFSNPQILLYWLHRIISRDFEYLKSAILLDEYTIIPLQLQTNFSPFVCRVFKTFDVVV